MRKLYSFANSTPLRCVATFDEEEVEKIMIENFDKIFFQKLYNIQLLFDEDTIEVKIFGKTFSLGEEEDMSDITKRAKKYFMKNKRKLVKMMHDEWKKCKDVTYLSDTDVFYILVEEDVFPLRVFEIISGKVIDGKKPEYSF